MIFTTALALSALAQAQWIWAPGTPPAPDVYFRKTVALDDEPTAARLDVTCDDAFELYVNGEKVAESKSWYVMKSVDLLGRLHKGRNTLAIHGHNVESEAGLLVRGAYAADGLQNPLVSDADWRISTREEAGWNRADFDDSAWTNARVVGPFGVAPWGRPKSEVEVATEMRNMPLAAPSSRRKPNPASPDLAERFTWKPAQTGVKGHFVRLPIPPKAIDAKIGTKITGDRTVKVDFGREIGGWVEVEVEGALAPDVDIVVGEAQTPQGHFPVVAETAGNRTVYRLIPPQRFTGFRFAWIEISKVKAPVTLRRVEAMWRMWPANYQGSFECSDSLLNRIWHLGAYTVRLNLDPVAFGAILRPERGDRFPWMGDDRVTQRTVFAAFGGYDLAKADLDYYVKPGQERIELNGIPGYTLDWVIALHNYWMHSGDSAMAKLRLRDVRTILRGLDSQDTPPGWLFTDWEPGLASTTDESVLAFHFKYVHAARAAAEMAKDLGSKDLSAEFGALADKRARFLEGRLTGLGTHATTNAILAGFDVDFPKANPGYTATPYFTNFVLEALSKNGQNAKALDSIRTVWGGMVKLGATSAWEYFLPEWTKTLKPLQQPPDVDAPQVPKFFVSLCHPWSGGATAWLSEHVLGVTPTAPGFSTCQVWPFFGNLAWAKGAVPTPHGPIRVSWSRKGGNLKVDVQAPAGVKIDLVLPVGRYRVDHAGPRPAHGGFATFHFRDAKPHTVESAD